MKNRFVTLKKISAGYKSARGMVCPDFRNLRPAWKAWSLVCAVATIGAPIAIGYGAYHDPVMSPAVKVLFTGGVGTLLAGAFGLLTLLSLSGPSKSDPPGRYPLPRTTNFPIRHNHD